MIEYRQMSPSDVGRIAEIDLSEQVAMGYFFGEGKLEARDIHMFMKF